MTRRKYYNGDLVAVKCKNFKLLDMTFVDLHISTGEFFRYHQPWVFMFQSSNTIVLYNICMVKLLFVRSGAEALCRVREIQLLDRKYQSKGLWRQIPDTAFKSSVFGFR
jgi:hypothetical protein